MSKPLNKYITVIDYAGKILIFLSGTSNNVSFYSFTTVIITPIGIASANISLVVLITNATTKMFLKTMGKKNDRHRIIA